MNLTDPITTLLLAAEAFRAAAIEAAVHGGLALAAYGMPRLTHDADFAVAATDVAGGLAALQRVGLRVSVSFDRMRFGGVFITRFALIGGEAVTGLNVVGLVEPRSPRFARRVLERAIAAELRATKVRVVAPEDYILIKSLATRPEDTKDAAGVIRRLRVDGILSLPALEEEARLLASEISDYPVARRSTRSSPTSATCLRRACPGTSAEPKGRALRLPLPPIATWRRPTDDHLSQIQHRQCRSALIRVDPLNPRRKMPTHLL